MYFKIKVQPEARDSRLTRMGADRFSIQVKEKAENNLANKRALGLLAEHLKVPPANIRIISGHKSPHKLVFVRPRTNNN